MIRQCRPSGDAGMRSGADKRIFIRRTVGRLLLVLALQELHVDFGAVDADKFASAIGEAGRRQQQKKLLEIEALNGALHGQEGVIVRYRIEHTVPTPGPVDAHDADAVSVAERNALRCLVVVRHLSRTSMCQRPAIAATFGAAMPTADILAGAA